MLGTSLNPLKPTDTIVTFNYDLVLERLQSEPPRRLHIALPGERLPKDCSLVFKLHGSVDWKQEEESSVTKIVRGQHPSFPLEAKPGELVVGTPGPTKNSVVTILEDLWLKAETALKQAFAVVFIGYRFPPTDAVARHWLLKALENNQNPHLSLHTVLGPSLQDDASVRIGQLLRYAMENAGRQENNTRRAYRITQHPLWAEDFLGYVRREQLL